MRAMRFWKSPFGTARKSPVTSRINLGSKNRRPGEVLDGRGRQKGR